MSKKKVIVIGCGARGKTYTDIMKKDPAATGIFCCIGSFCLFAGRKTAADDRPEFRNEIIVNIIRSC